MRRIVSFMHVSLDGYVAGPNGEMNWISVDEEIFDYAGNRTDNSDMALYGRVTYDMMEGYWPTAAQKPNPSKHDIHHSGWYNQVQKVVLSKMLKGQDRKNTTIVSDNAAQYLADLKAKDGKEIIMFGSPGVRRYLQQHDLVDEYWLFVNPILLGKGIPMFSELKERAKLKLIKTHAFTNGVVCLHYERVR